MDLHPEIVTRVKWEPENDKAGLMRAVDEIVTGPLTSLHLERMSDGSYWIGLCNGEAHQVIFISSLRDAKIVARTQSD